VHDVPLTLALTFPVYVHAFGLRIHPHMLMEVIAYTGGFQLYLLLRRRSGGSAPLPLEQNLWIIVSCIFGALFGSKLLAWLENPWEYWEHRHHLAAWIGGKTIVGGLLGGWLGVELAKKRFGITQRTGDTYVFSLIFGITVGRVGCFLTGLDDHTHGTPTSLPCAINFGDGVPRHPTQLYEIAFLLLLGLILFARSRRPHPSGLLFRQFFLGYFAFRFFVEFIKPRYHPYLGLSAIQLASLGGVIACAWQLLCPRGARQTGGTNHERTPIAPELRDAPAVPPAGD
jgi:phosphatidylglycerol---prolipoprotein diacylglyceryl transferase